MFIEMVFLRKHRFKIDITSYFNQNTTCTAEKDRWFNALYEIMVQSEISWKVE